MGMSELRFEQAYRAARDRGCPRWEAIEIANSQVEKQYAEDMIADGEKMFAEGMMMAEDMYGSPYIKGYRRSKVTIHTSSSSSYPKHLDPCGSLPRMNEGLSAHGFDCTARPSYPGRSRTYDVHDPDCERTARPSPKQSNYSHASRDRKPFDYSARPSGGFGDPRPGTSREDYFTSTPRASSYQNPRPDAPRDDFFGSTHDRSRRNRYERPRKPAKTASVDLYQVLGVSRDVSVDELRKAYRKLSLQNHPDRVGEEHREAANKKMAKINQAYDVLSNAEARRSYDLTGEVPVV